MGDAKDATAPESTNRAVVEKCIVKQENGKSGESAKEMKKKKATSKRREENGESFH